MRTHTRTCITFLHAHVEGHIDRRSEKNSPHLGKERRDKKKERRRGGRGRLSEQASERDLLLKYNILFFVSSACKLACMVLSMLVHTHVVVLVHAHKYTHTHTHTHTH